MLETLNHTYRRYVLKHSSYLHIVCFLPAMYVPRILTTLPAIHCFRFYRIFRWTAVGEKKQHSHEIIFIIVQMFGQKCSTTMSYRHAWSQWFRIKSVPHVPSSSLKTRSPLDWTRILIFFSREKCPYEPGTYGQYVLGISSETLLVDVSKYPVGKLYVSWEIGKISESCQADRP